MSVIIGDCDTVKYLHVNVTKEIRATSRNKGIDFQAVVGYSDEARGVRGYSCGFYKITRMPPQ